MALRSVMKFFKVIRIFMRLNVYIGLKLRLIAMKDVKEL